MIAPASPPCPAGGDDLGADDLTWPLEPLPWIEFVDLNSVTDAETRHYATESQWNLESVRRVLADALAALAWAAVQAARYEARLRGLLAALWTAREATCDLRAPLHTRQDGAV